MEYVFLTINVMGVAVIYYVIVSLRVEFSFKVKVKVYILFALCLSVACNICDPHRRNLCNFHILLYHTYVRSLANPSFYKTYGTFCTFTNIRCIFYLLCDYQATICHRNIYSTLCTKREVLQYCI